MSQVIIYMKDGNLSVVHPVESAVAKVGIDAIAKTSVPAGVPYKIIDKSEVPVDRTYRAAWMIDESELTDGVGHTANAISELPEADL